MVGWLGSGSASGDDEGELVAGETPLDAFELKHKVPNHDGNQPDGTPDGALDQIFTATSQSLECSRRRLLD